MLKSPPKGRYVLFVCYAPDLDDAAALHTRCAMLTPLLNARPRRRCTAADAAARGPGGITRGARATGVSRRALAAGGAAWPAPQTASRHRVRRPGGGRTRTGPSEQTLQDALAPWLDPLTRGAPTAPWRWTGTSGRQLAEALRRLGAATRGGLVPPPPH